VVNNLYLVVAYFCQLFGGRQAVHHLPRTDLHASPEITDYVKHKKKQPIGWKHNRSIYTALQCKSFGLSELHSTCYAKLGL